MKQGGGLGAAAAHARAQGRSHLPRNSTQKNPAKSTNVSSIRVDNRPWQLIRLAKFPNVIDRKRVLVRHASSELAPLRRANAGAFHCRFGALNDFADWPAVRHPYKNGRISRHWSRLALA